MKARSILFLIAGTLAWLQLQTVSAQNMEGLERLASLDPKPFVLVEAQVEDTVARAQGVVISSRGHVLSVGHLTFVSAEKGFSETFRIGLRGQTDGVPAGFTHLHKTTFADREGSEFQEHIYDARLVQKGESRFVGKADLSVFQLKGTGELPQIEFYSKKKPKVEVGDTLYLCHFNSPHLLADPTFLMNPVKIVGVAQTSSGQQYLAEGYYRVGSSGGAILKDGLLIGIQSSAYTINAKDLGEIPLGLISFHLVWRDLVTANTCRLCILMHVPDARERSVVASVGAEVCLPIKKPLLAATTHS
jgi:hypothetical protein